ncbi:MAG TPA: methionine--tRNA ligase [Rhodospirillales bacterium]
MSQRYYVTTPIYYVNDDPHIGHAYTTLACDVIARFKRLDDFEVKFLTGTDEHGQKVAKSAAVAGMDPQAFTDKVSKNFRDLAGVMNYSNDDFIRTTEDRHTRACQALWRALQEKGEIYLGSYAGWYAVRDEAFYAESELKPGPGGKKIAPSGAEAEWVEEPSYFFRLSAWQERLLKFYDEHPDFVLPKSRRNEVTSFVSGGLQDLSISRTTFTWGVPVPGDEAHIMYVWLDALTNYITAVGYPITDKGEYTHFWPADLHMVGKDILRFHAVYWPAFLMAAGLQPPKRVFAHGWWTNEGQKISKSVGNIIDPIALVKTYGLDPVRFFLLREVPFGNDGDFSHAAMVNRMNGELANDYGNLAQRVLSMIARNCSGKVPDPTDKLDRQTWPTLATLSNAHALIDEIRLLIDRQAFHEAIERVWAVIRDANRFVDSEAPWALKNTDVRRMEAVLYVLAEVIRHVTIILQPFMPGSCGKILDQLAVPTNARDFNALNTSGHFIDENSLKPGTPLPKPEGVFPRFQEPEAAKGAGKGANPGGKAGKGAGKQRGKG